MKIGEYSVLPAYGNMRVNDSLVDEHLTGATFLIDDGSWQRIAVCYPSGGVPEFCGPQM